MRRILLLGVLGILSLGGCSLATHNTASSQDSTIRVNGYSQFAAGSITSPDDGCNEVTYRVIRRRFITRVVAEAGTPWNPCNDELAQVEMREILFLSE